MAKFGLYRGDRAGFEYAAALLGVVFLLVVEAYFPFRWDPPHVVHNDVTRTADGALRFGEMNRARTAGTPGWLADARRSGRARIDVELNPRSPQEHSPVSIMMLARDYWHTDFAIGQDHAELLVWLRRPGSNENGDPPLAVSRAIRTGRWNHVQVALGDRRVQIDVNGRHRLTERLPSDALRSWGPGLVALGDEVHGGEPWQGKIRQAAVRTPRTMVDYARPGALSVPAQYMYLPDHVVPFPPAGALEWGVAGLHFLTFIPIGFLAVRSPRPLGSPLAATAFAITFAVALAGGKFLFDGRHTEVLDILVQTAGAFLGAVVAWQRSGQQKLSSQAGR